MELEDKWTVVRSGYRDLNPEITAGDILYHRGDIDRMLQQIGKRIDRNPEHIRREVKDC